MFMTFAHSEVKNKMDIVSGAMFSLSFQAVHFFQLGHAE